MLNQKIEAFEQRCRFELMGFEPEMVNQFIEYWTELSLDGKKVRFMGEKYFSVKRRFTTWRSMAKSFKPALQNKTESLKSEYQQAMDKITGNG